MPALRRLYLSEEEGALPKINSGICVARPKTLCFSPTDGGIMDKFSCLNRQYGDRTSVLTKQQFEDSQAGETRAQGLSPNSFQAFAKGSESFGIPSVETVKSFKRSQSASPSIDFAKNSFINFVTAILVLLITFNLGWLVMFIRLYSRWTVIRNLNRTLFNFESFLLLGNLGIFILFIAYALGIRSLRDILGRK